MKILHGPSVRVDHLNTLHDFLTARGWRLDDLIDTDDTGYPADPEASWHYPDSYNGIAIHELGDVTPTRLSCRFGFLNVLSDTIRHHSPFPHGLSAGTSLSLP